MVPGMLDRQKKGEDTFAASCDYCSEQVETFERTFIGALEELKRQGWIVVRKDDRWMHACPNCHAKALMVRGKNATR